MSRCYDIFIEIEGCDPERAEAVKAACSELWAFDADDFNESRTPAGALKLEARAEGGLGACVGERDFAMALARAVWLANAGFCGVETAMTCLEDLPREDYAFDDNDYADFVAETARIP